MQEENHDIQEENSELYEHYRFTATDGQEPLRVDKFLMNFIEMQHVIKFSKLQKLEIF